MPIQAFLKFDKTGSGAAAEIVGESKDKTYSGWIELRSFSFGLENPVTMGSKSSGGSGAGKVEFKKLVVTKVLDSTTPGILQSLAMGAFFTTATLEIVNMGASVKPPTTPLAKFELKLVAISDIEYSGSAGDEIASEQLTIQFGAIKVTSFPQAGVKAAKFQEAAWSRILNKDVFEVG